MGFRAIGWVCKLKLRVKEPQSLIGPFINVSLWTAYSLTGITLQSKSDRLQAPLDVQDEKSKRLIQKLKPPCFRDHFLMFNKHRPPVV